MGCLDARSLITRRDRRCTSVFAGQLSAHVALFMSQVVVLVPGNLGVPVTGVLPLAVEID